MSVQRKAKSLAAVLVGIALPLAACGGGDEGETTSVRGSGRTATTTDRPKTTPAATTTTTTATKPATGGAAQPAGLAIPEAGPFTYKPGRDPFQSYFDVTGEQTTTPSVPLTELQKHELSRYKLTAVVTGTVQPAAVILGPNGKAHFIKRGTLIGPPRGRVAQILSDRVVVEREFKDRLERIHKLKSELRLRTDEEELKQ